MASLQNCSRGNRNGEHQVALETRRSEKQHMGCPRHDEYVCEVEGGPPSKVEQIDNASSGHAVQDVRHSAAHEQTGRDARWDRTSPAPTTGTAPARLAMKDDNGRRYGCSQTDRDPFVVGEPQLDRSESDGVSESVPAAMSLATISAEVATTVVTRKPRLAVVIA